MLTLLSRLGGFSTSNGESFSYEELAKSPATIMNLSGAIRPATSVPAMNALRCNEGIKSLIMLNNVFESDAIYTLCELIMESETLEVLNVAGCGLNVSDVEMICDAARVSNSLTHLYIGDNDDVDEFTSIPRLHYLDLYNTVLPEKYIVDIADSMPLLQHLNLDRCRVTVGGARAIAHRLGGPLWSLSLMHNPCGGASPQFAAQLARNVGLKELRWPAPADDIATALETNTHLQQLRLCGPPTAAICRMLTINRTLQTLRMDDVSLELRNALAQHPRCTFIAPNDETITDQAYAMRAILALAGARVGPVADFLERDGDHACLHRVLDLVATL